MADYLTRGGDKLAFALAAFGVDPRGWTCADLGSHIGGFLDCLLRHGAARVYSIDTAYGTLDWNLRNDPRVVVMERTNALHAALPEPVDLVTIDVGWTRQALILPAALRLARPGGLIITLIKPQYESRPAERRKGVVRPECLDGVMERVWGECRAVGAAPWAMARSPLRGGGGNVEFLALVPVLSRSPQTRPEHRVAGDGSPPCQGPARGDMLQSGRRAPPGARRGRC